MGLTDAQVAFAHLLTDPRVSFVTRRVTKGSIFGEPAMWAEDGRRKETVVATTPVTVLVLSRHDYLTKVPDGGRVLIHKLSVQVRVCERPVL